MNNDINLEELKKEIKHDLIKQKILTTDNADEIDLLQLINILARNWRTIIGFTFGITVLSIFVSLLLPNIYISKASIFVHTGSISFSLGNLPSYLANFIPTSGRNNVDYVVTILNSDKFAETLIKELNLATNTIIFGDPIPTKLTYDDVIKKIQNDVICITKTKEGLIKIEVETKSATLSAEIANTSLKILSKLMKGPQQEKKKFIENLLKNNSIELKELEEAFKNFQDQHKVIEISEQAKALVDRLVKLEEQKIQSQINLKMYSSLLNLSGNLPELVKIEAQKVSEQAKLQEIEKTIASLTNFIESVPQLNLDHTRLIRNLKVKEKVHSMLVEQLELAKISAVEEGSYFEVIDNPRIPNKKSKPHRTLIVIISFIAAFFISIFVALISESLKQNHKQD